MREDKDLAKVVAEMNCELAPPLEFKITKAGQVRLLMFTADTWRDTGKAAKAEALYGRLLRLYGSLGQAGEPNVLLTAMHLGQLYAGQMRHDKAITLVETKLRHGESLLGPENAFVIDAKIYLALLYCSDGQARKSLETIEAVLADFEDVYGKNDIRYADLHQLMSRSHYLVGEIRQLCGPPRSLWRFIPNTSAWRISGKPCLTCSLPASARGKKNLVSFI